MALRRGLGGVRGRWIVPAAILVCLLASGCVAESPSRLAEDRDFLSEKKDLTSGLLQIGGTVFMNPSILRSTDPTALVAVIANGTGERLMFDRRTDSSMMYDVFLFDASFEDELYAEIQVNSEFGTVENATRLAETYARAIGHLPTALRAEMNTVWIHDGTMPFGGGNNHILIHVGQAREYEAMGVLEEALVHEASHTSLDATHASTRAWTQAQQDDADFISDYARDHPAREDVAESFLPWMALRTRGDRLEADLIHTIETRMPARLAYFDAQGFNLYPVE